MARESHRAAGQQVLPVRSIFQRLLLRRKRTRAKRLRFLAAKATLPVRMISPAWKLAHEYGPDVAAETGLSVRRQILDIWALSTRHWITPAHYYLYRLHDAGNRRRVAHYLHHDEISRLVMELYPGKRPPSQRLRDKSAFYEACSQFGLPTVPILAEFSSGEMMRWYGPGPVRLPPNDLFSKPTCGSFGVGAKSWRFDGAGRYQGVDGGSSLGTRIDSPHVRPFREDPYTAPAKSGEPPGPIRRIGRGALHSTCGDHPVARRYAQTSDLDPPHAIR